MLPHDVPKPCEMGAVATTGVRELRFKKVIIHPRLQGKGMGRDEFKHTSLWDQSSQPSCSTASLLCQ